MHTSSGRNRAAARSETRRRLCRAVRSLKTFQTGRKPIRPSAGLSASERTPCHCRIAASSEPYFLISQSPYSFSTIRICGSGMLLLGNVQKNSESSFCISTDASAGSSTSLRPVGRGRRCQQRIPPGVILLFKIGIEDQCGNRARLAVVTVEPRRVRLGLNKIEPIERNIAINPFRFHGLDTAIVCCTFAAQPRRRCRNRGRGCAPDSRRIWPGFARSGAAARDR